MKNVANDNKGFTLIDVVVAAVILVLAVLPICSGFVSLARSNARVRERASVNRMIVNEIEKIKVKGEFGVGEYAVDLNEADEYIDENTGEKKIYTSPATEFNDNAKFTMTIEKKTSEKHSDNIAYIEFTLTYDFGTDDTEDDISIKGVYLP